MFLSGLNRFAVVPRGGDPRVIEIAWKAQNRLRTRYLRMCARGKGQNITIVAMAGELLGFIWDIARTVERQVPVAATA
jgi:hypothetical protein